MFMHNKRLQYTVRVSEPNHGLASLLLEQFGGPDVLPMGILQLVPLLKIAPLLESQLGIFISGRYLDLLHEAPLG